VIHALVSTANVPLMRVGFLPMIPKPVTEYATVRKALTNFQSVRQQLNQNILPVFCDEGVFQIVTEVVMTEPDTFADISNDGNISLLQSTLALCWTSFDWYRFG
jgi:hypothetical protein